MCDTLFDMMEHTKEIPGIDKRYQASAEGHIVSYMGRTPRKLASGLSKSGLYRTVSVLEVGGRRVNGDVHRLVCKAFHGLPQKPKMQASHLDGNSHDNRPENLMWETPLDNSRRKRLHGTDDQGVKNSRAHLTRENLVEIKALRKLGWTQLAIADKLGVRRTTITRALNGTRYGGQIHEN